MEKGRPWKEKIIQFSQKLKNNKKRFTGIRLIALGVVLGIVSRAAGGNPFQDFTSGILMGLSAGILLAGTLLALLSPLNSKKRP